MIPAESLRDARVLVTGGHGFIGKPLSTLLGKGGAHVIAVGRTAHPDSEFVRSVALDLCDANAVNGLFEQFRPDVVLHLASHVVGKRSADVVMSTLHNNLTSTVQLLLAAQQWGCRRVVLTGSLEEPDPDTTWAIPSSPYAAAKLAAGNYGRMFHALFGLSAVILRVFMVYGPGQSDLTKLIPHVITTLSRGETPGLSSGTRQVDWVYVDDVVEAFVRAAVADSSVSGHTFDVGTGQFASVRDVVESIFKLMGRTDAPAFGSVQDRPLEQIRLADVATTRAALGWSPRFNLDQGLRSCIEWYSSRAD